jgi:DNA repair photolyase
MADEFKTPLTHMDHRKFNTWCRYNTRLDTYGRGCLHNCSYCYARHLLDFRGNWHPYSPAVVSIGNLRDAVSKLESGELVRLGGMTDCFQPAEREHRMTLAAIRLLNERRVHYLITTKSATCVFPEYLEEYDPELAHFQISITATDDWKGNRIETASPESERMRAAETLCRMGFDTTVRLSPFIPEFVDAAVINAIDCGKVLIEFLKVNPYVRRCLDIDYHDYTCQYGGHMNLELERKIEFASRITDFDSRNIGEFVREHYLYFRDNYNTNPYDCCNVDGMGYDSYPETGRDDTDNYQQLTLEMEE